MKFNKSKQIPLVYNKDYQCIYITVNSVIKAICLFDMIKN